MLTRFRRVIRILNSKKLTQRGIRPRPVESRFGGFFLLPGVKYGPEGHIFGLKFEKFCEFLAKIENILTRWSGTEVGSIYEKSGSKKSRWTVP